MPITRRLLIALALLAATLPAQSGLEVIAAYYGTDRSFLDVTAIVRAQAQPDGLGLTVGTAALGGDPFPGQLKTLRIYYKLSGQFQQGEWKDSENIALGRLNNGGRNTGMRGGGRPVARERPTISAPLTIIQATYGAGTRTVDVTSLLQSRIQRDQLDFEVPGSLLGDPAPGLLKELLVSYQWNGQTREARVRDGERLRLPTDQVTTASPVATGLKMVSAQYGSGTRVTDVTALLGARIAADRLVVLVENNSLGGDPSRGADKVLNVVYEWNGQRYNASAKEGQTLRLPPDQAAIPVSNVRTPTNGVCLYPGQNFQGTPFCAELGQDQARVTGTWGSLRLFGTARQVDLFETAGFTGRTVRLTAELADLSRAGGSFFSGLAPWATTPASFRISQ